MSFSMAVKQKGYIGRSERKVKVNLYLIFLDLDFAELEKSMTGGTPPPLPVSTFASLRASCLHV